MTTFAVVAAAVGGGFSGAVVIVLDFANLIADGFSMAVSNYLGTKSQREELENARAAEGRHIEEIPEGEREEIRQIFAGKGFSGKVLEKIVAVITADRKLWVETRITEELGMNGGTRSPHRAAIATFVAFVCVGLLPLLPFLCPALDHASRFIASAIMTAIAFTAIGVTKGFLLDATRCVPASKLCSPAAVPRRSHISSARGCGALTARKAERQCGQTHSGTQVRNAS